MNVFKKKLPLISENVFEFVKCNRATISDAEVTEDFNWNYTHIKTLVGQCRLYTRLIIPAYTLEYKSDSDSELHIMLCIHRETKYLVINVHQTLYWMYHRKKKLLKTSTV